MVKVRYIYILFTYYTYTQKKTQKQQPNNNKPTNKQTKTIKENKTKTNLLWTTDICAGTIFELRALQANISW